MNEIASYLVGYGIPILLLILALIAIVMAMGVAISWNKYISFGYLLVVLLVPTSSDFGLITEGYGGGVSILWVKGTKSFFFSFLDMTLFGTWLLGVVLLSFWTKNNKQFRNPLAKWYLMFAVLFLGYVFSAMFAKSPLLLQFSSRGVINVFWQGMFISLLFSTLRTAKDIKTLTWIIVFCLASRDFYGLFRYFFMGGDPQNYYANFQNLSVKLTFFDINDSILASLLMGFSTWKLLVERHEKLEQKLGYAALALMGLLIPVLTSRRTAQGGVLMAIILLFFMLPRGKRAPVVIVFSLIVPLALSALALRSVNSDVPFIEKILIDVKTDSNTDPRESRFYELETAWKTIREEPFFGVGPAGSFKVTSPVGLYYHGGVYDYVHSGFGHVLLKTGFVGLLLFIGIFITYIGHVKKGWRDVLPEHKALVVGALCGFIAQIPNMTNGTAVPEIRSMQVLGFIFAVPLICIAFGRNNSKNYLGNLHSNFQPTLPMKINENLSR